jgi:precorrin-2 dehydrogenase / sirohydrochlorin ferrochelatase
MEVSAVAIASYLLCHSNSLLAQTFSECDKFVHVKLFPLFLKLQDRRCLVVGAGTIAEGKIAGLLDTGARLTVVAPQATPQVLQWAKFSKIEYLRRAFETTDLDEMFLVVASTSDSALHRQIFAEARKRGVLCNVVDVPELCDFYYPAVVQRGSLQIAVSTSGESPALAQRLRKELEVQFGPEYEAWLETLAVARADLQADKTLDPEERKRRLHALVTEEAFAEHRRGHRSSR